MNSPISVWLQDPIRLRKAKLLVLVTALLLRTAWGMLVPVIPASDSSAYDAFAQNIALGYGYGWKAGELTAYWPVGTSAVYALLYKLFGHHYLPVVILNILVGTTTVMLAMSLVRRWWGEAIAVLTGLILAVWPLLIEYTTILASELLFNFCILSAFWLASIPSWKWFPRAIATGTFLAASSYIRPIALLIAPIAFLREAFGEGRFVKATAACAVSCIVMMALILPWSMRNQALFNRFVLMSTNSGTNFWMGNNPESSGLYMPLPQLEFTDEVDRDRYFKAEAWNYIKQYPVQFVARTVKKLLLLHKQESIGVVWNEKGLEQKFGSAILLPLKIASSLYWWLILICAVLGSICLVKNKGWKETLVNPAMIMWLYFGLVHAATVVGDRYHMPSIPFIAMLAAYGFSTVFTTSPDHLTSTLKRDETAQREL